MKRSSALTSLLIGFVVFTTPILTPSTARAQILDSGGIAKSSCTNIVVNATTGAKECSYENVSLRVCIQKGNCGVEHFIILIDSIIRWAAGMAGVVALLTFVMGGIWMIFSAGNSSRVERGKDIVKGSTVALFWILGSWLLISFVLQALNVSQGGLDSGPLKPSICQTLGEGKKCGSDVEVCYQGQCLDKCKILELQAGPAEVDNFQCTTFTNCRPSLPNRDSCQAPLCQQGACEDTNLVCCKVQ